MIAASPNDIEIHYRAKPHLKTLYVKHRLYASLPADLLLRHLFVSGVINQTGSFIGIGYCVWELHDLLCWCFLGYDGPTTLRVVVITAIAM